MAHSEMLLYHGQPMSRGEVQLLSSPAAGWLPGHGWSLALAEEGVSGQAAVPGVNKPHTISLPAAGSHWKLLASINTEQSTSS